PGGGWPATEVALYNGEPRALGIELYTNFLWPFEVASFILLVAVVGAIVLARREETVFRDVTTRGISLGRGAYPGSPQEAEMGKVLAGRVEGVLAFPTPDDGAPAVPVATGGPGVALVEPPDPANDPRDTAGRRL
ncbi:MAG TPA: NADH-quinone oxidoreductase subunit J, partial [Chloroflexia bacterium]|nr:NADH-quinone oxidoreductase subunit J [Chloroflexia bacterium]